MKHRRKGGMVEATRKGEQMYRLTFTDSQGQTRKLTFLTLLTALHMIPIVQALGGRVIRLAQA